MESNFGNEVLLLVVEDVLSVVIFENIKSPSHIEICGNEMRT